jgi:hypothetical protein
MYFRFSRFTVDYDFHPVPVAVPDDWRDDARRNLQFAKPNLMLVRLPKPAVDEPKWTRAHLVAQWAKVFGLSRRTMGTRLKTQQVRNQKVSRQSYKIAVDDILPAHRKRFLPVE